MSCVGSSYPPPYHVTICAEVRCQKPCLYRNGKTYLFCSVKCATSYQRDMALIRCRNPACLRQFCNDVTDTCPYCSYSSTSIPISIPVQENSPLLPHQSKDEVGTCKFVLLIILLLLVFFVFRFGLLNEVNNDNDIVIN